MQAESIFRLNEGPGRAFSVSPRPLEKVEPFCSPIRTDFLLPPHGLSTEQFPVSAYAGSSKNLKDLKDLQGATPRNRQDGACIQCRRNRSLDQGKARVVGESQTVSTRNRNRKWNREETSTVSWATAQSCRLREWKESLSNL